MARSIWRAGAALAVSAVLLCACTAWQGTGQGAERAAGDAAAGQRLARLLPADVLLVGEQHDAPEHQRLHHDVVRWLAAQDRLAALTLEMAEQGRHTRDLPPDAGEAQVRAALGWRDAAWPWAHYGPAVMAAVRAGVPVLGANLPVARQRQAMQNAALDARLPPAALARQQQRIRQGHCNALPESQIAPMTRIQIARDMAMADTLLAARQGGRVAVLLAGNGHVHRSLGVPVFLPPQVAVRVLSAQAGARADASADSTHSMREGDGLHPGDMRWPTPPVPEQDYCARFRKPPAGEKGHK